MRCPSLIGMALLALSACSSNQQPTQEACVVAHTTGFVGAGSGEARITVAQNASPCVISAVIRTGPMGQGEVVTPPAHGTATVRLAETATQVAYTPERSYVGPDRFQVAFGPNFTMTVLVEVVPVATNR